MLQKPIKILLGVSFVLLAVLVLTIGPVRRPGLQDRPFFQAMARNLDSLEFTRHDGDTLLAGWSTGSITPEQSVMLAGYGIRGPVDSVHDMLEAKTIVLDNGKFSVAIISLDLLLFPGEVAHSLAEMATNGELPVDAVYTGAIHTHNGYGHWEGSPLIQIAFGKQRKSITDQLLGQCVETIQAAYLNRKPASMGFARTAAPEFVVNRLDRTHGKTDHFLRAVYIEQEAGPKSVLVSYSAHPVVLDTRVRVISRDYPGYLTDFLERPGLYDQAVFMAGMVGSHTVSPSSLSNFDKAEAIGQGLGLHLVQDTAIHTPERSPVMVFEQVTLALPPPQLRISKHFALRSWIFRSLLGELHAGINVLRVGDLLMLGMPCDFSGEIAVRAQLDSLAASRGTRLMITSFNGDYIGYVTADRYYNTSTSEEVRHMNWTGPNMGAYFAYIIREILASV